MDNPNAKSLKGDPQSKEYKPLEVKMKLCESKEISCFTQNQRDAYMKGKIFRLFISHNFVSLGEEEGIV